MIAALILGTYAVAVALLAPVLLDRLWPSDRTPRLTVLLLQILSCSFLAASVGAGLALALSLVEGLSELNSALDRCADTLPVGEHSSVATWVGHVGGVAAAALVLRVLYCVLVTFGRARLRRRAHLKVLRMLATRDERLGVLVLDHPAPACYCLPGDIVITTGALSRLTEPQLEAVLLHERAHVAGHHHLIIALAAAIGRTVPRVRLLTYAERETRRLVELIADDAAVARTGAPAVATALAVIGTGHAPDLDPTAAPMPALAPAGVRSGGGNVGAGDGSGRESGSSGGDGSGSSGRRWGAFERGGSADVGGRPGSDGSVPAGSGGRSGSFEGGVPAGSGARSGSFDGGASADSGAASRAPGGPASSAPSGAASGRPSTSIAMNALGVDASPTLRRVRRLLRLDRALTGRARALSLTAAVFMIALPITLIGVSGASLISHCPPDTDDHDARGPAVTTVIAAEADPRPGCDAALDCQPEARAATHVQTTPFQLTASAS